MAVSRGGPREAQAEHVQLERLTEIAATQPNVEEGYTPDADIAKAVKRLAGYLQPVVTLIATMVPPSEESRMRRSKVGRSRVGRRWLRLRVWCSW